MRTPLLPFLCLTLSTLELGACTSETLQGGSTVGAPSTTGTPSESSRPPGATDLDSLPDQPLTGTIEGRTFTMASADLEYSTAQQQWFLTFRNYSSDCRTLKQRPDPATALLVNVGKVTPEAGQQEIRDLDGHGAAFQIGLYDATSTQKATSLLVTEGALSLTSWSDVSGTVLEGRALLRGEGGSEVKGRFTVKVCPAR